MTTTSTPNPTSNTEQPCSLRTLHSGAIVLKFVGPTPPDAFTQILKELDAAMPASGARLVWDLRLLVGHNPEVRRLIIDFLSKQRKRIFSIDVIVPDSNAIVRMVSATVGLAVGIKINLASRFEETLQ